MERKALDEVILTLFLFPSFVYQQFNISLEYMQSWLQDAETSAVCGFIDDDVIDEVEEGRSDDDDQVERVCAICDNGGDLLWFVNHVSFANLYFALDDPRWISYLVCSEAIPVVVICVILGIIIFSLLFLHHFLNYKCCCYFCSCFVVYTERHFLYILVLPLNVNSMQLAEYFGDLLFLFIINWDHLRCVS